MNIKLITLTAAIAFASAMAQDNSEDTNQFPQEQEAPAAEPAPAPVQKAAPAPAPAAAQPAADTAQATQKKGIVHGIAYNTVGNAAADKTIRDNLNKPYKMAGSNLFYIEPTSEFSAVSFGSGNTKFISFDNYGGLAMGTFGIANSKMGISLSYALAKELDLTETKTPYDLRDTSSYTVDAGDILRLRFSMLFGAFDINASAFWLTYQDQTSTDTEFKDADGKQTTETDYNYWDLGASLFVSNDPSAKDIHWIFGINFTRHENYYERETKTGKNKSTTEVTGKDANIYIQPSFDIGTAVLKNKTARVLLGVNTRAPIVFYDEFDDDTNKNKDSYFTFALYAVPNIFAELKLGNCWRVFGGANYNWTVFSMESEEFIKDYNDELNIVKSNTTVIKMRTGAVSANLGARFQYSNFAMEASIENAFYSNPFTGFSSANNNNNNFIANFGAFIYF